MSLRLKSLATLVSVLAVLSAAAPLASAGPKTDGAAGQALARQVLERLDARLHGITTMKGHFVQTFVSAGLGVPQSEEGVFLLKAPDLLRWEYEKPEKKLAVSDGVHTWLHLPEEGVVYRGSVAEWKRQGGISLLVTGDLPSRYDAESLTTQDAARPGDVMLHLRPKAPDPEFKEIEVEIEPKRLDVRSVTMVDSMGNRIGVAFAGVQENVAAPPSAFEFVPPAGARVIDQDAAGSKP